MSFSSLPPELVHQIIESAVPHIFHSETYKERQETLCSLSLVSKLFRSIAQPLLFEIVKPTNFEDAENLPTARVSGGDTRPRCEARCLIMDWRNDMYGNRTQAEQDRFSESLRVFESVRDLTVAYGERSIFAEVLSMTSDHLTYLQITNEWLEVPETTNLPNLRSLTLYQIASRLFTSLLSPGIVPNLQNFALVDSSQESAQWLKDSSVSSFLLRLGSIYMDSKVWIQLDNSFRQSVASRTLVNIGWGGFQEALKSTPSIVHARLDGTSTNAEYFNQQEFCRKLDTYASFIENTSSLSLKSFYLDSSFSDQSNLPQSTQSSINNLSRICQERKIDLVFDRIPVSYAIDPCISKEFIRRQKIGKRNEAGADGVIPGQR
ncbi:hypothetical protein JCM3765_005373 [Sporobolomyces pararoseus]